MSSPKEVGANIARLRKRKEITQEDLARLVGISRGAISMYEIGERIPDPFILQKIADKLGVSTSHLLGEEPRPDTYTAKDFIPVGKLRQVPVLGVIRAGEPILAEEHIVGYELVPESQLNGADFFYLKVTGDSMTGARIMPGDLVLVRRQPEIEDGEIAVVLVNDEEATLKRVHKTDGGLILESANPKYPPVLVKNKEVKILGKVVEVKFKL